MVHALPLKFPDDVAATVEGDGGVDGRLVVLRLERHGARHGLPCLAYADFYVRGGRRELRLALHALDDRLYRPASKLPIAVYARHLRILRIRGKKSEFDLEILVRQISVEIVHLAHPVDAVLHHDPRGVAPAHLLRDCAKGSARRFHPVHGHVVSAFTGRIRSFVKLERSYRTLGQEEISCVALLRRREGRYYLQTLHANTHGFRRQPKRTLAVIHPQNVFLDIAFAILARIYRLHPKFVRTHAEDRRQCKKANKILHTNPFLSSCCDCC